MKIILPLLASALLASPLLAGLSVEEILEIAAKPASDVVPPEFAKFPQGSRYRISTVGAGGGEPQKNIAEIKYVEGGYFVSETQIEVKDTVSLRIVMVTWFNPDAKLYGKSVLVRQKLPADFESVVHLIGNFLPEERVMNWTSFPDDEGRVISSLDAFTDDSSRSKEIVMQDGEIVHTMEVTAERLDDE